ncbi:MAG: molybdopterin molybdotransferase MoeA [Candidatus Sumerlaeia bacterium]|nr:molybdopterin molybdotransferase MoeA [Candidatus Sumerlaeia bacterium]
MAELLFPDQARAKILSHCRRQAGEKVPLDRARGRILAQAVCADRDIPPADRSTMDGYAVRAGDLALLPCELKLIGEVTAGSAAQPHVRPGTCVRILTGANIPRGADAVAIVESTHEVEAHTIRFHASVQRGENILPRGSVARKGQILLNKGARLGAPQIALCASVGADPVAVVSRPRVGVVCTGEELAKGSMCKVAAHIQRDANGPALRAAIEATEAADCRMFGIVGDRLPALRQRIARALAMCDVVLVSGGVSAGKYDLVPKALEDLGCRKIFHGVKVKPGKPLLFAMGPKRQLVFGLPGNPMSVLTTFHEFVAPALRKMTGRRECGPPRERVRLAAAVSNFSGRIYFAPVKLESRGDDLPLFAMPLPSRGSADVLAGALCDGVVVLTDQREYAAGEWVEYHPWRT